MSEYLSLSHVPSDSNFLIFCSTDAFKAYEIALGAQNLGVASDLSTQDALTFITVACPSLKTSMSCDKVSFNLTADLCFIFRTLQIFFQFNLICFSQSRPISVRL